MDTVSVAVILLCAALALLLSGWWIGGRLSHRVLLDAGRRSLRRRLTARLGRIKASRVLLLSTAVIRIVFLVLAWRAGLLLLKQNPITDDYCLSIKLKVHALMHSTPVIILFDVLVIVIGGWVAMQLLKWLFAAFGRTRARLLSPTPVASTRSVRLVGSSTVRRLNGVLLALLRVAQVAAALVLGLVYMTLVFSLFPVTRDWVSTAFHAVGTAIEGVGASVLGYLPNLANLTAIALATWVVTKLLKFIAIEIRQGALVIPGFYPEWALPTYQLAKVLTLALALVVAFPFLPGSDSPIFHGMSVFFGVLISLGSTSFIANIVAGVVLTYTRGFRVGDRVRIADTQGDVVEKGLLVTRVRTIKNVDVTIPNSLVMSSHMVNYSSVSRDRHLILCTTVTLSYDLPWRMVHETLVKAALATPGILQHPRPFVMQTSLNDYHVSYELNAYTDDPNSMHALYSGLHQSMQDACNAAGFEILSPGYAAIRDGNASTIPADKRPAGHADPAFRVELRPPGPPSAS